MALLAPRKRRSKGTSDDAELKESSRVRDVMEKVKRANELRGKWVEEAQKCDALVASHQWSDEDEQILSQQRRPKVTFNLIRRVVAAIVGTEVQHRQRILFLPRKPRKADVAAAADLATDAVDWALELAKAPHERSIAFKDAVVRGVGCVGYRLDYEEDPDGRLVAERVDSTEMIVDPDARKQNCEDARWIIRKRKWRLDEVRDEFGKEVSLNLVEDGRSSMLGPGDDGSTYTKVVNFSDSTFPSQKITPGTPAGWRQGEIDVYEYQWWEREKYYRVLERVPVPPSADATQAPGPAPPGAMSATPLPPPGAPPAPPAPASPFFGAQPGQSTDQTAVTAGATPSPPSVAAPPGMIPPPMPQGGTPAGPPPPPPEPEYEEKWVSVSTDEYDELLEKHRMLAEAAIANGEDPPPPPAAVKQTRRKYKQAFVAGGTLLREDDHWHDGFTYLFMTWDWDPKDKMWFGLVRDLEDPQKAVNKWIAQGIHHFNSSAKGAVLVEPNAVVNFNDLPNEWAKPNAIIQVSTGAIASKKIEVVPPAPLPEAVGVMTQYAMQAMQQIPGVGIEMLAAADGNAQQPGVTVQNRQAQGLTILAGLFDALTRFRETEAKTVIRIVKKYLADGRMIRIGDPHDLQYRELLLEDFAEDYDLVIDDAPRSPDQKRLVWETMQTIMPLIVRQNGDLPDALKDFMPLPASAIADLKREAAERAAQPSPPPPKEQNPEYVAAEIALKHAQAQLALARAQAMLKQTGIGIAETAQDMVLEKRRVDIEERAQDRDAKIREDENTLNALDQLKRDRDPDFPGVRAG